MIDGFTHVALGKSAGEPIYVKDLRSRKVLKHMTPHVIDTEPVQLLSCNDATEPTVAKFDARVGTLGCATSLEGTTAPV